MVPVVKGPGEKAAVCLQRELKRLQARIRQLETEAALHRRARQVAEDSLRAVVEASDKVLLVLDADQRLRWISERAARLLQIEAQDRAPALAELLPDGTLLRAVDRCLASGQPQRVQVPLPRRGVDMEGRIVPVAAAAGGDGGKAGKGGAARAPGAGAALVRRAGAARDVGTDGPRAGVPPPVEAIVITFSEGELEQRLQQMRREFVANVSHELRSPLTSILGYAQTLLEDPPETPEQRERFITLIARDAERMRRLVDDLLNLSRVESGQAPPRLEWANLHNLVGRVLTQLRDQAAQAQVELLNQVPLDLRAQIDPGQIEQVVYNLVTNGIQYTPPGGRVIVSGRVGDGSAILEVGDTGVGIPAPDLPRIFERFYRVDKARSRATGGTGLGLSIVKHIVDAHRGRVSVESQVGQGTTFTVELPVNPVGGG